MYIFSKPTTAALAEQRLLGCLNDIAGWMKSNRLCLNPVKTQFMWCATSRRIGQLSNTPIEFGGERISPVSSVRNLGVIVDSALTFQPHISRVISSCFYQLRQMKSSLKLLPFDVARSIVNCFVVSRIDYCNSLLANSPQSALNRLQRVMNAAARLVCHAGSRAHVSGLLRDRLHWLRVPQRIDYKLCLLVFKALHAMAPSYLVELCRPDANNAACSRLRSAARGDLHVPRRKTNFGDRAFAVAGPKAWNRLPPEIRTLNNLTDFKSKLKSFFFLEQ
jgi:hypothetical protein